jgi:toxin ParE1/3/4
MAAVQRSSRAEIDLLEIWGYIANDDPLAADRQLDRIDKACDMLAANPQGGPRREDLARGLRFYPVGNYLIFYTVGEKRNHRGAGVSRCARLSTRVPMNRVDQRARREAGVADSQKKF